MKKTISLKNLHTMPAFALATMLLCISPAMLAEEKVEAVEAVDITFDNLVGFLDAHYK